MSDLSEFSKEKLREFVASCPKAGSIKIGSSQTHIVASKENRAEVFGKPTNRKADGIHMRGVHSHAGSGRQEVPHRNNK